MEPHRSRPPIDSRSWGGGRWVRGGPKGHRVSDAPAPLTRRPAPRTSEVGGREQPQIKRNGDE